MEPLVIIPCAAAGLAAAGAAGAFIGARTLFNRVIPRQDKVMVDISEMADMDKWEEYKVIIHKNKEWLLERPSEHITVKARDGITLHSDYFPADGGSDTVVIAFHGYTSCGMSDCSSISSFFLKKGMDALIVDNRAHGRSEGKYYGFGILDRYDCLTWVQYVNERFGGKKNIILFGVSMGAATVLMAAGFKELPDNIKAIISDCAFTSPYDVFAHILKRDYHLPEFPIMNITNVMSRKKAGYGFRDYSVPEAVKTTDIPVLFIHGAEDKFVPTEMSRINYDACASRKKLLIVENAGHAASYYENVPLYEKTVGEFLEEIM